MEYIKHYLMTIFQQTLTRYTKHYLMTIFQQTLTRYTSQIRAQKVRAVLNTILIQTLSETNCN